MTLSRQTVRRLLAGSRELRLALKDVYALLPASQCRRRGLCCSLLPEMNLLEALAAIQLLLNTFPAQRLQLIRRLVHYFFINPLEITCCPFLQGKECLIYEDRFFGCRAYGLWSRRYFERQAGYSRKAKQVTRQQWGALGVSLPETVINFHLPYCPYVEVQGDAAVGDEMLSEISDLIEALSGKLRMWHNFFQQNYFSDLSFLLTSLAFGVQKAIKLKFDIVREVASTGNMERLSQIVEELPDLCGHLVCSGHR